MLNASSLEELSEIRLLMDAGISLMMLGGWLDFVLMYCGWSFGFLVRAVGTVCKVEGDVQVVNNFHVCLYNYVKSMSLEASCYVFPYSFSLWSGCPDNHPEGTFKQRFSQHKATFKHRKYTNSTELSK